MTNLEMILAEPMMHALGWALLHFMWQGALVALFTVFILRLLGGHSAGVRYAVASAALFLMLVAPIFTAWRAVIGDAAQPMHAVNEASFSHGAPSTAGTPRVDAHRSPQPTAEGAMPNNRAATSFPLAAHLNRLNAWNIAVPWLVVAWLVCALALFARVGGGLMMANSLRRAQHLRPIAPEWRAALDQLAQRLNISRRVGASQSPLVRVPTTIGWLRPVVLIPESAFASLSAPQLEAILAHELTHIRRHDYLINILQSLAEALLFYHPAVWWVARQIRVEREHVCDDRAIAMTGSAVAYARALTEIEILCQRVASGGLRSPMALGAGGAPLLARIQRLVKPARQQQQRHVFSAGLLAAALAVVAIGTVLAGARSVIDGQRLALSVSERNSAPATPPPVIETAGHESTRHASDVAALIARDDTRGEDEEVRRAAVAALGEHAGSVIVMDPRTGRVYAIVNQEWALKRGWAPASTFKLITALAGIGERQLDPAQKIRVTAQGKTKSLDLTDALAISDTPYFEIVGERVGAERLLGYARQFGLGEATGANYAGESSGVLPPIGAALKVGRLGGAGAGVEVTPLQLGVLVSMIANGGTRLVPHTPRTPEEAQQFKAETRKQLGISQETLRAIVPGMIKAVTGGTAQGAHNVGVQVAGKTGTSMNRDAGLGLFASYAPVEQPRIVIVVQTHGAKESGGSAAEIAGNVYRTLAERIKTPD